MTHQTPNGGAAPDEGDRASGAVTVSRPVAGAGRDRIRFALLGVGQTLITAGLVMVLFVAYEVWITNIFAHYKQQKVENDLVTEWANNQDPLANSGQQAIPLGAGIANLYVPRFGEDYHFAIVQGTDGSSLDKGPGHYAGTALPGQLGNFAVAGHRVGKGEPFLNLDQLRPGDAVVVETATNWYIYRVFGDASTGNLGVSSATAPVGAVVTSPPPSQALSNSVVGQEIVSPSDGKVIMPVPNHPDIAQAKATGYLMTLTTCHPKFTATKRMIVHAYLARAVPTSGKALPRELAGGRL
jgi:sortase A